MKVGDAAVADMALALLWMWFRPAAAALILSLAWELPYAMDMALKRAKKIFFLKTDHFLWGLCSFLDGDCIGLCLSGAYHNASPHRRW